MATLKAVRGTRDLLPPETELWNRVEATARAVFARYGFGEIRTPLFEATELFARGVGEETDIVSKEMYTWDDGGRPEVVRLMAEWLQENKPDLYPEGMGVVFPVPDYAVAAMLDGKPTYVEFRVFPPKRPNANLIYRTTSANQRGMVHRIVMPRWQIDLIDASAYRALGIVTEGFAGKFVTSEQSLTLRPENTAGVVRAYIEHKLDETGLLQKLFYIGPQFRRERPQRGRYRQFWQIGAEVIGPASSGSESPIRDAEILEMLAAFLNEVGVTNWRLALNSIGSAEDRKRYNQALREALEPVKSQLCEDNQRRADTNPLRVLDSKDPNDQDIINTLPKIADYLDEASRAHFEQVKAALDACAVPYVVDPRLVRGLDYYTRTTFEFTVPVSGEAGSGLGTQNALLGGGRYDGLSEMLGGPKAPGIGFAIGEDRLILTLQAQTGAPGLASETWERKLDAFIAPIGAAQNAAALALASELRAAGLKVEVGDGNFRLKKSFDLADKLARRIIIVGEDEVASGIFTVKTFSTGEQIKVPRRELATLLRN